MSRWTDACSTAKACIDKTTRRRDGPVHVLTMTFYARPAVSTTDYGVRCTVRNMVTCTTRTKEKTQGRGRRQRTGSTRDGEGRRQSPALQFAGCRSHPSVLRYALACRFTVPSPHLRRLCHILTRDVAHATVHHQPYHRACHRQSRPTPNAPPSTTPPSTLYHRTTSYERATEIMRATGATKTRQPRRRREP